MDHDFYEMLGLESTADRPAIEAALSREQARWSAGTRNPKTKLKFQQQLDLIPTIRRSLLGTAEARAAYDAELHARRRVERDRKLDELQRLLRLRAAKGGLTVSDRTLLRAEAVRLGLTADDLDRMAMAIPARPETPEEPADLPDPAVDALAPSLRRQIRATLDHLGTTDLYDLLGVRRDASTREILERADDERRKWMNKTQVTAEKTARLEAVSYAQSHLGSPESRARYDRTLVLEAEERFGETVGFAVRGVARLDNATRNALFDEAAALGIERPRAERLIDRACRAAGVAVGGGESGSRIVHASVRCPACGGLTVHPPGREPAECRHCRASLRWQCPSCRREHGVDLARCPCGFRRADVEPLIRHFQAAQDAHRRRDIDTARVHLEKVREFAPNHVGARKGLEKLAERVGEIERVRAAFEVERARRRYGAAKAALEAWGRLVDPADAAFRAARDESVQALREAHALEYRARKLQADDPKGARELFRQALTIVADLAEARDGLMLTPPEAPTELRADYDGERVHLRWKAPPRDELGEVRFRVLRKRQAVPAHTGDGVLVAETAAGLCDDPGVAAGDTVGYAVFSLRGGVESTSAATVGPLLALGEVRSALAEACSGQVRLSWSIPHSAIGVRVVRKIGAPPNDPEDGSTIEAGREGAVDTGLEDDRVFHYAVYVLYPSPDGRVLTSRGTLLSAIPHQPPGPVTAMSLERDSDGRVRLRWPAPERGRVRVLRSPAALPLEIGHSLTAEEGRTLAGHWLEPTAPDSVIDPRPPAAGTIHYIPMTTHAGRMTVGRAVAYTSLADPSDLRATRSPGRLGVVHLRWRWSPQGNRALVLARRGSAPRGADDPDALRVEVDEADYGRIGYHPITLPAEPGDRVPWHISVRTLATVDGAEAVSPGLDPTGSITLAASLSEVTVSYHVRPSRIPGRPWSIAFRTEPPGEAIPPMALVAHPRTVPLSVDDGQIIDRFPASRDGATFKIRAKANLSSGFARAFADPLADPTTLTPIRLKHPEAGGTRV